MGGEAGRRGVLAVVAASLAAVLVGGRVGAESEFLSGEGMPYAAFDRLPKTDIAVPGAVIHVGFAPGPLALPKAAIFDWIRESARAVSLYYGRFPVRSLRLLIVPVPGSGVPGGTTWGYRGAAARVRLGEEADAADLKRDWVMTHEMVHLALPHMSERHNWLSEGLAVYIEPIARAQAGDLTEARIWSDMVRDMPKGLPVAGGGGLDESRSWGRTYWGGALFCLTADIAIRRGTGDRLGLQNAMRGVLAAGGNHESDWPIEQVLAVADRAVGLTVMTDLYRSMGLRPVGADLAALWRDLGIRMRGGDLSFDDAAPLASARAALVRRTAS